MATTTQAAGIGVGRVAEQLRRPYVLVFVTLGLVTLFEVNVPTLYAHLGIGGFWQVVTLILTSVFKAIMVALYYMHLRYEPRVLGLLPIAPLVFVAALIVVIVFSSMMPTMSMP